MDPAILSELSQPLSAVSNYLGAARNMIARLELEDDELLDAVTRAGEQMARARGLLDALRPNGPLDRQVRDT
jgi:phosphoglycerate-specific signal transduction histidine kinase